ncbi:MAG: F0F1 ATP synthase subunit A [Candidatus Margulisiibacteriota bacterium]
MNVIEHLSQKIVCPLQFGGIDLSITNGVIAMWLAVLLVTVFFWLVSRQLRPVPGKMQNLAEVLVLFIRDEIGGQLGDTRDRWLPFLAAIFTFILACNLLGLVPGVASATANINTTAALALIVFFVVQVVGVREHGFFPYLKSFIPEGVPLPIAVFMVPIELISTLAKPFSLAMRLFANMFAGHAVMFLILSMIVLFHSWLVVPLPVVGDTVFLAFELFIAFIQAFVFTYLSALYIATAQEGH